MFVTQVECDVGRKMMLNKEMLMKRNRDWARSELETLTSSIQPWYARNTHNISKHSHSSDIKDSSMKIMSVTSVFIRVKNLNIFSRLFKMTSTVNDLKLNESSNMLMKQNMSISLSITTLTKTDRFLNSLQFHASELT